MHHLLEKLQAYFQPKKIVSLDFLAKGYWGETYVVTTKHENKIEKFVIKRMLHEEKNYPLPHDQWANYVSSYHASNRMPEHARVFDVMGLDKDGFHSALPKEEYFMVLEFREGKSYFQEIERIRKEKNLTEEDIEKAKICANAIAKLHKQPIDLPKEARKAVYRRVTREFLTHGELFLTLYDNNYGDNHWFEERYEEVFVKMLRIREKIKNHYERLSYVHGDFWRANMLFNGKELVALDASRFPMGYGEPGVDVFSGGYSNYFMNALADNGSYDGPLNELGIVFMKEYIRYTNDEDVGRFMPILFGSLTPILMRPGIIGGKEENVKKIFQTCLDSLQKGKMNWKNMNTHLE